MFKCVTHHCHTIDNTLRSGAEWNGERINGQGTYSNVEDHLGLIIQAECHKSALNAECHYAEYRYAECCYTECRGAYLAMQSLPPLSIFAAKAMAGLNELPLVVLHYW